jgi:hypothetical protein
MSYYDEDTDTETGYDVVDEIGAVAKQIQGQAVAKGIALPKATAIQLATRKVMTRPTTTAARNRTQMGGGFGSGMATACGLGTANFPAGSLAGAIVNLAARSEEPFVCTRIVITRADFAAVPPAVCAGIPVVVLDVRIGQRSVLANAAGIPVEAFGPQGTGGQWLGTNVVIARSTLITVQFGLGAVAVPAAEAINCTVVLMGHE